jgi:hypothetical protein
LSCLQYAHDHGCPWNTNTCSIAAREGHLECLRYAHEHGCHWNKHTFYLVNDALTSQNKSPDLVVINTGLVDCIRYAHEHGRVLEPLHTW